MPPIAQATWVPQMVLRPRVQLQELLVQPA
jgi:hypothetical protein